MFCFFSGDTCHKFPPNQKRNTHSIKNNTTSTATKPPPKPCHGPAHVFSCWRSSCYAYGLWRVLRRRPMRGGLGWFTLGSEWISCLLFAQKSGPVNFLKTHFGNSSSNDLVLEFRPLQIAWVNWEFYAELFCELILIEHILRDLTRFQCLVIFTVRFTVYSFSHNHGSVENSPK